MILKMIYTLQKSNCLKMNQYSRVTKLRIVTKCMHAYRELRHVVASLPIIYAVVTL